MPEAVEKAIQRDDHTNVAQHLRSEAAVDLNIWNASGQNGVIIAAKHNAVKVLELFLDRKAQFNILDSQGSALLHYAA